MEQMPVDSIFLTCCALHNMLLDHDGLNKVWNDGVSQGDYFGTQSDYLGEMGNFDVGDLHVRNNFAMYWVHQTINVTSRCRSHHQMDFSGSGLGAACTRNENDRTGMLSEAEEADDNNKNAEKHGIAKDSNAPCIVQKLPF